MKSNLVGSFHKKKHGSFLFEKLEIWGIRTHFKTKFQHFALFTIRATIQKDQPGPHLEIWRPRHTKKNCRPIC
jgi:hypothetical protein